MEGAQERAESSRSAESQPAQNNSGLRVQNVLFCLTRKVASQISNDGHVSNPCLSIEFLSPPFRPCGFGPLAPLRPTRLRARRAGWGLGGRVSAGEGQGGLWGDVLSTHCEEAGDVTRRRVDWPSA